jgi:type 1 glutamine amidotransferase
VAGVVQGAEPQKPLKILVMLKKKNHPYVKYLEENFAVVLMFATPDADKSKGIPGAEKIGEADVVLLSLRRTDTTEAQTKAIKDALTKGKKPIVGIRQASHAFNAWPEIDREVFGAKYGGHFFEQKDKQIVQLEPNGKLNPITKDFKPFMCNDYPYTYTQIASDVDVLMTGGLPGKMQPLTWVRTTKDGQRSFYTRYDEDDLVSSADCRTMVTRALFWAANVPETRKAK